MGYEHQKLEQKWQQFWSKNKTFKAVEDPSKPKYYVLDMFPYPSGAGLHVGHLMGYTATDIIARYKWQKGHAVLHPMGWDSFGLPAEQYAIRTGTHPAITTHANVKTFKRQLSSVGYAYDWDREITTSEPDYYKWTQWIFTKLFEKGLAYQADLLVNYCPALGTVLANEEVENGFAKEGGHPIERRPLKQWVLKITAYADRLLKDLELVDWPESLKKLQVNWIGRSVGAQIDFLVENREEKISVFTTRPDTLFGATYMVLSPEHPFVAKLTTEEKKKEVHDYQKKTAEKSDLERTELAKEKSGVFSGGYAINPVTGKKIPVWIADYVLMGYGTGAIMAVPAHDQRDHDFAQKFFLPIIPVVAPSVEVEEGSCWSGEGSCINSSSDLLSIEGFSTAEGKKKVIAWLEENNRGKAAVNYRLRDWLFSRQRYWGEPFPILHFADGTTRALELDELPLSPPEVAEFTPSPTGESPLAKVSDWVNVVDPKTGKEAKRETNTMPQWAGSCWYYLRFCDPHNNREAWDKENEKFWMPVDLYVGGAEHAVLHLLYARFWHKVLYDLDLVSTLEPFQRLCNQGLVVCHSYKKSNGHYVAPEEVTEKEGKYFHWESGEELSSQIEKMSKSKLNGVTPDVIIEEFGADATRLYSMFMGPIEKERLWSKEGLTGCRRFLNRFYEMALSEKLADEKNEEALKLAHRLVDGVTHDLDNLHFNTAIAKLMEFVNHMVKLPSYSREAVLMAVQALAPLAPHLAEELWQRFNGEGSVAHAPWPNVDPKYLEEESITYIVQVNGKLRGKFDLPKDQSEEKIISLAKSHPQISKHLEGEIRKVIFVPNKLLNFVIR